MKEKEILDFIEKNKNSPQEIKKVVGMTNSDLNTPLHIAVLNKNIEAVKILVDAGADVDAEALLGVTPLQLAAAIGLEDVVDILIAAGAEVNARDHIGQRGRTALDLAVKNGHIDTVKKLVMNGAYIDDMDKYGKMKTDSYILDFLKKIKKTSRIVALARIFNEKRIGIEAIWNIIEKEIGDLNEEDKKLVIMAIDSNDNIEKLIYRQMINEMINSDKNLKYFYSEYRYIFSYEEIERIYNRVKIIRIEVKNT